MEVDDVDAGEPMAVTRGEEDATTASGGDETTAGKFRAAAETRETALPLRVLDEYEFRDKFNEGKFVNVHGSKPCEVLVLGKARKIEGGESELPSKVLAETLTPQDKPPHALKLMEVHDWVIRYGGDAPEIWLVTPRAWYKLLEPSARFEKYVTTTLRRARFVNAVVQALAQDWNLELERGLGIILEIPVVAHDVPMAIKTPTKAARLLGDTSAEAQREAALDGRSEEDAKDSSAYRYTRADVVVDGFFIASQIETLVKSGALRPTGAPASASASAADVDVPSFVVDLQTWTSDKHQLGTSTKASRLERDRARRERIRAEKQAEKEAKNKPHPPRMEPPPQASRVLERYSARVGPALLAETLTLWDFSQVFTRPLHFPRCPLDRFARAFLSDDVTAAESALLRDFMTACLRVVEGRVDSIDHETMKTPPERARWWTDPVMGINDIGELDWEDRANHLIVEYQRWINGRARPHAVRAVAALDAGEPIERAPPTGRVSLAVALCAIASESEAFREYFTEVYDRTRERRKKGEFHVNPPTLAEEVPKTEKTKTKSEGGEEDAREADRDDGERDGDAMETDDVKVERADEDDDGEDDGEESKPPTLAEYRREQLTAWRAEFANRSVVTRGKPVAVDEHGRRYFALGGLNNACRLFVETPPDGWLDDEREGGGDDDDDAPRIVDGVEMPKRPKTRPPVDDVEYEEDLEDVPSGSGDVSGLREYGSRWGVYEPGESLDALSAWCNASYDNERFITKLHRLVSNAVDGADAEPPLEQSARLERIKELCDSMSVDAYAHLESVPTGTADERTRAVRLFETVKFIAHSAPFWRTGDMRWMDRFIRVASRIEVVCSAEEPSLIDLLKTLAGIESVFSQASLMDDAAWTEMKPTWLAQLRFYVYGPRAEDELAGAAPSEPSTTANGENIPGLNDIFTAPELLEPLPPLTVRRAANLVNQFLRYVAQDSHRMSQRAFQLTTGIEHGVAAIKSGEIVALIRRGLSKTYARYVEKKSRPRNWIDVNSLRPVERCAVLGVAYRGCEEARRGDGEVNPPCAWFMCLLLDEPDTERQASTRSKNSVEAVKTEKDERRLVMAPLYAGDIAEYVLPWSKYQEVDNKPFSPGNRIMMQFEGVQAADESRGIVSVNGAVYYLGRVRKTRASPDRWETVMVVFDSDPEDYMWVSPWEIVEAPEEYHDPVHLAPEPVDIWKSLTPEDMAHIARCKAIARRLGWPSGDHRKDFDKFREEAFGHGDMPIAPVFCGSRMNLHRVFIETLHLGGYEQVTRAKFWKTVARSLGRDLTSHTSASFAMRRSYERCLYPMETYLTSTEMVEKLGLIINEEATTMEQFPGSLPSGVANDEYVEDDDDAPSDDDDDDDDDDDKTVDDEMEDANDEEKPDKDDAEDYKLSDEDFDEDGSDDGESDSDWK